MGVDVEVSGSQTVPLVVDVLESKEWVALRSTPRVHSYFRTEHLEVVARLIQLAAVVDLEGECSPLANRDHDALGVIGHDEPRTPTRCLEGDCLADESGDRVRDSLRESLGFVFERVHSLWSHRRSRTRRRTW